jgi:serine/threonine protein kinase
MGRGRTFVEDPAEQEFEAVTLAMDPTRSRGPVSCGSSQGEGRTVGGAEAVRTASKILSEGTMLAGYSIEGVIGIGGMAVVYRAEQVGLERLVALKVLSADLSHDDAFRERFRREGRNVAKLKHPNIVTIFDSGEENGRLFLAMELVEGVTLAERMRAAKLTADETIEVLRPIADALDAAHRNGIVHRDIKPQNILIDDFGKSYLADFGIAKTALTAGFTVTRGFIGTYDYAAPEQALGQPVSVATDIYGLTAVLFQCLTGTVPYPRETDPMVLNAHVNEPPPSVLTNRSGAEEINRLLARGMAKKPEDRFETASAMIAEAASVIAGLPVSRRGAVPPFRTTDADAAFDPVQDAESELSTILPDEPDDASHAQNGHVTDRPRPRGAEPPTVTSVPTGAGLTADGSEPSSTTGSDGPASGETGSTKADRRREFTDDVPARPGRRSGRRRLIGTAALLASVVTAGVVAVLATTGSAALHLTAHSGPLAIRYTAPWRRVQASTAGPAGAIVGSPVSLEAATASLNAGGLKDSAAVPGGVPPELRSRFGAPTSRVAAAVAGHPGELYTWTKANRSTTAYVVPTTTGDAAIICTAPAGREPCATLARTATLTGVQVMAVGPDHGVSRPIDRALTRLVGARRRSGRLSERPLTARARPAGSLAGSETAAAGAISRVKAPPRFSHAIAATSNALHQQAAAVSGLEGAAARDDRRAYTTALSRVSATNSRVTDALRALSGAGLTSVSLTPLRLTGLPPRAQQLRSNTAGTGTGTGTSGSGGSGTGSTSAATGSTSAGTGSTSAATGSTSAGTGSTSAGTGSTSAGTGSTSAGTGSTSAGTGSTSAGTGSTSAGTGSTSAGKGSTSAGKGSTTGGTGTTGKTGGAGGGTTGSKAGGGGGGQTGTVTTPWN